MNRNWEFGIRNSEFVTVTFYLLPATFSLLRVLHLLLHGARINHAKQHQRERAVRAVFRKFVGRLRFEPYLKPQFFVHLKHFVQTRRTADETPRPTIGDEFGFALCARHETKGDVVHGVL